MALESLGMSPLGMSPWSLVMSPLLESKIMDSGPSIIPLGEGSRNDQLTLNLTIEKALSIDYVKQKTQPKVTQQQKNLQNGSRGDGAPGKMNTGSQNRS